MGRPGERVTQSRAPQITLGALGGEAWIALLTRTADAVRAVRSGGLQSFAEILYEQEQMQWIGEAWTLTAVQSLMVQRVGAGIASGDLPGPAAAMLKAMAALNDVRLGEIAQEIAGDGAIAWPATDPSPYAYSRLASRRIGIGGGTTEMQLNAIAERILDLPREPSNDRALPFSELRHNSNVSPAAPDQRRSG